MSNKDTKTITFRVSPEVAEYVKKAADRECRTMNSYLLSLVMEDMRNADARKTDMAS